MYRIRLLKQRKLFVTTINTTQYLPPDFVLPAGVNALSVKLRWTWVIFKRVRTDRKNVYVIVRPSVSPSVRTAPNGQISAKISRETPNLFKIRQKYRALHMQI